MNNVCCALRPHPIFCPGTLYQWVLLRWSDGAFGRKLHRQRIAHTFLELDSEIFNGHFNACLFLKAADRLICDLEPLFGDRGVPRGIRFAECDFDVTIQAI